jgi:hypothetical protein
MNYCSWDEKWPVENFIKIQRLIYDGYFSWSLDLQPLISQIQQVHVWLCSCNKQKEIGKRLENPSWLNKCNLPCISLTYVGNPTLFTKKKNLLPDAVCRHSELSLSHIYMCIVDETQMQVQDEWACLLLYPPQPVRATSCNQCWYSPFVGGQHQQVRGGY